LEALFGTPYSEVRLIAASPVTPPTVYSRLADGSCVEDTSVPPGPLHEMTTIDTKALPEFTQEKISHGKRLDSLVWRAADGATLYGASFDTQRTMICRLRTTLGGTHCIPVGRTGWIHSNYVDDQCTVLAGSRKSADCEAPQYFTRSTKTVCGVSASEIFEAGAELGQTYVLSNSICEGPIPSSGQFYEIGPPLALAELAEAKPLSIGVGRLRHVYIVADGTSRSDHLYDTQLGTPCHFVRAADGTMRCLPSRVASVSYLDSACAQPFSYLDCPDAAATHYVGSTNLSSVDYCWTTRVHRTEGAMLSAPAEAYFLSSAGCVKFATLPAGIATKVSAELPPSDFVQGVEGLE
ncbi:MAG: hypothetical protein JRH20_28275, partial [Deltaproteobacteria bacterium]|nr:hypothetical protein [Deltaproteobacteria bacterium]